MPTGGLPRRELSKSKFAMYLRTKCDRELYLSLFSNRPKDLAAAGIPPPLKSRPGVQLITASGREFEYEQYDLLVSSIPTFVVHKSAGRARVDLSEALHRLKAPALILQPQIEPEGFRDLAFGHINVPSRVAGSHSKALRAKTGRLTRGEGGYRENTRSYPTARAVGSSRVINVCRSA